MSFELINRSADLKRLQTEGYEIEVINSHLIVRNVPYVTPQRTVERGDLVAELTLAGDRTSKPSTHVAYFTGQGPCHKDGSPIRGIEHGAETRHIGPGLTVVRSFSNKPPEGYADYYAMMTRYAEILSAPACAIDKSATAKTFRPIAVPPERSVFAYLDTNSARGRIQNVADKLHGHRLGLVGLGGTGSYILDLVAKTPVAEIRLYDDDVFLQHNAFRAPGAASLDQLRASPSKVDYLAEIYSRMHRCVRPYRMRMTAETAAELSGLDFVFISMDSGPAKKQIIDALISKGIAFIDTGMGVHCVDGKLLGLVRVTTATPLKSDHLKQRLSYSAAADDAYATNIQIADLNMLNAALAVIKWKKLVGFYHDVEREHQTTYSIDGGMLLHEDIHA